MGIPLDTPIPAEKKGAYVLQAGSYKKFEDADRVKAQLALQGIESTVQRVLRLSPMLGMSDQTYATVMTAGVRLMTRLGRK